MWLASMITDLVELVNGIENPFDQQRLVEAAGASVSR
jgi:hypothetical protein